MALNVRCPDKRGEEMRSVHTVCTNVIFYYSRYRTKVNHLTTIYSFSRSSWKCPWLVPCRRGARRRLSPTPPLRSPWRRQAVALVRRRRGSATVSRPPSPHARQEGGRLVQRQPCNRTNISFGHNIPYPNIKVPGGALLKIFHKRYQTTLRSYKIIKM